MVFLPLFCEIKVGFFHAFCYREMTDNSYQVDVTLPFLGIDCVNKFVCNQRKQRDSPTPKCIVCAITPVREWLKCDEWCANHCFIPQHSSDGATKSVPHCCAHSLLLQRFVAEEMCAAGFISNINLFLRGPKCSESTVSLCNAISMEENTTTDTETGFALLNQLCEALFPKKEQAA